MTLTTKHQRLAALRPLSPESVASLAAAWDVRMVHESNAIEGNSLTLRETELVLSKGVTVSGKPLKDHIEALNLAKAWEQVKRLARPDAVLTERDLLDLHRIVLTRVEDDFAGSYRTGAVRIAGSSHVPPNPVKVPDLMEELFAELQSITDPVERAAKLHHGIARIHPFTDGNGRAARLAMNFVLLAAGYPPISIPTDLRKAYYDALEAADSGDFQSWLDFLTEQLDHELNEWLSALEPSSPEN
ncbi:MAG: Fic family protein [Luteolibacter sp.]|jgi:Fic family protein|nr:Fic family protein [Luteolibacter sp.]